MPLAVARAADRFLDLLLKHYIMHWYRALNHSQSPEFPKRVRSSMNHVFTRLARCIARSSLRDVSTPIFQDLTLHVVSEKTRKGPCLTSLTTCLH